MKTVSTTWRIPASHRRNSLGQGFPQSWLGAGSAVAFGRTDYPGSIVVSPPLCRRRALKAFVHYIPALGWLPQSGQSGMGSMPEGEEVLGQSLVFDAGWGKAEAGDDALGIDRKQQVEAFIPAPAVAPANVSRPGQPTGAPAFGGPGGDTGTVQSFVGAVFSVALAAGSPSGGSRLPGSRSDGAPAG